MKILIIPDVHGRDFWIEPCKHIEEFDKVIFLGDYHDPYPTQVGKDTSRHRLRDELVPFVEANRDKVICLFGNHDGNYLVDRTMADRYDGFHHEEIRQLLTRLNLQVSYQIDNYLFTHSGVLPAWLNGNHLSLDDLKELPLYHPALRQVSPYRGSYNSCGSCIWGDVREYDVAREDDELIPDLFQIFGHTQLMEDPVITDNYACLDCRKAFVLDTETKELKAWAAEN